MNQAINNLLTQFKTDLNEIHSSKDLEQLKVKYLGKKGPIQDLMKTLREVSAEERPAVGKEINDLKIIIEEEIVQREEVLIQEEESLQLAKEALDITLPGRKKNIGRQHPLTQEIDRIIEILCEMGFSVQYGPDIETDYYNFEVLNLGPDHSARDMQDTFYISPHILLRTHTSNIQARVMESKKPPIRIIAPGTVYRNEAISARSHVFFHQIEAVYIDQGVSFADLFATMDAFLAKLFQREIETRYRPSYFPFVEPGLEVDVSCLRCNSKGCNLCKHTGWLEIGGAGMIHPEVLKNGGIDPETYTGFAWGLGVERLVMLVKGIHDIRLFTENDLKFLSQFTLI